MLSSSARTIYLHGCRLVPILCALVLLYCRDPRARRPTARLRATQGSSSRHSRMFAPDLGYSWQCALHNRRGIAYMRNGEIDLAIADYTKRSVSIRRASRAILQSWRALLDKNAYAERHCRTLTKAFRATPNMLSRAMAGHGRSSSWATWLSALEDADQAIAADAQLCSGLRHARPHLRSLGPARAGDCRFSQGTRARSR